MAREKKVVWGVSAINPSTSVVISVLIYQQRVLHAENRCGFITYCRKKGRIPENHVGYSERNIKYIATRIHQIHEYGWTTHHAVFQILNPISF